MIALGRLPSILRLVTASIYETFSSTLYIGPARAKSDRYYRYQDLNVSEIDPDGENFAMFLNSLHSREISAFSDWVRSLFGYGVKISQSSGHISIQLQYGADLVNVVDTGYGVSQILPVLGQIWWANERAGLRRLSGRPRALQIIAIEQPELHLHPAHQALLADAFVGALSQADKRSKTLSLVVETHSEMLVNRLGSLIAQGRLPPSSAQVVLFEDDPEGENVTRCSIATFGRDGDLRNWPYGFFLPNKS